MGKFYRFLGYLFFGRVDDENLLKASVNQRIGSRGIKGWVCSKIIESILTDVAKSDPVRHEALNEMIIRELVKRRDSNYRKIDSLIKTFYESEP